jgi:2-hydroxymuconate-semialdehyde hydrolase
MKLNRIIISILVVVVACILSNRQLKNYNDELYQKVKNYGDNRKPTLVIIPGLDGVVNFFGDVLPELTLNYHVIVFNIPLLRRNMSKSHYSFDYFAHELHTALDNLNISKVSLVGESFGGVIAQNFAFKYANSVNKLVLLSSLAKTELPSEIQFKLDYLLPIIESFGQYFPSLAQMLFARIHVFDIMEPSESIYVRELFIREASAAHFYSVMARIRLVSKLNIIEMTKKIIAPTLVVYGSEDHFTKEASLELATLLPHSQIKSLPGGHLSHITSPKEFANMIHSFISDEEQK